jgi:hypothetical protein
MDQEQTWKAFDTLPPQAQQQVLDFIAILHRHYSQNHSLRENASLSLRDDPFIGMWQDRTDMMDSSEWVRNLRRQEWA